MTKPLVQSTGRRKEAVARVRLRPSEGDAEATITINGRDVENFFRHSPAIVRDRPVEPT